VTSFAGVMAFIFADLIVLPIIAIYRKYYGWAELQAGAERPWPDRVRGPLLDDRAPASTAPAAPNSWGCPALGCSARA